MPRVRIEYKPLGKGLVPTVPFGLKSAGVAGARIFENALFPKGRLGLRDEAGAFHVVNLETIQVCAHDVVPIIGRDALEAFSAVLHLDFHAREGHLDLG